MVNAPFDLSFVPGLFALFFLPRLFWLSIPGLPLYFLGFPGMQISAFGAFPTTAVGYVAITTFWLLISALIAWRWAKWAARRAAVD